MILPALIYFALNGSGVGARGWGIPMATDIGFALAFSRCSANVSLELARVYACARHRGRRRGDTRNCVLLYPADFFVSTGGGRRFAGGPGVAVAMRRAPLSVYVVVGFFFWAAVLSSGVHATIAGVILGLIAPIRPKFLP